MRLVEKDREVEVSESNLPLLEDLLLKWGYDVKAEINVKDIDFISCELSAWGIPWKRINWSYT